jgi:hypothetical protein
VRVVNLDVGSEIFFPALNRNAAARREANVNERETSAVYRRLIHDTRISHGAFRLWHYLRDRKNQAGKCFPSQRTIAKELGCKTSSLPGWTSELREAGYVSTVSSGQNHHLVYTVLYGDFCGVMPKWATRGVAHLGDANALSRRPKGQLVSPISATRGVPETGDVSNFNLVNSESNLPPSQLILRQKELERVEAAMGDIRNGYDSHQEWSKNDRSEFHRLKNCREELKQILGFRA